MTKKFLRIIVISVAALFALVFVVKIIQLQFVKYNQPSFLTDKKILVAYYSRGSNTENIAKELHKIVGGEIKKINPINKYPDSAIETFKVVQDQKEEKLLPQIEAIDIDDYDIVFVGSPIWAHSISLPLQAFLKNNNFNGKIVVPFVSYLGGASRNNIKSQIENIVMENSKATTDEDSNDTTKENKPKVLNPLMTFKSGIVFLDKQIEKWLNSLEDK